jgi:phosphoglycolate phosphatase/pyrophosphatase PpaX
MPDEIYGWDLAKEARKPSPFAILDLMEKYSLKREEIIVVDDLKPGYDMARAAGVAFVGALWGQPSEKIRGFMRENCKTCFDSTAMLEDFLFNE